MADLYGKATLVFEGANDQVDVDVNWFKKGTDSGKILRILMNITVENTGTAYTADSLSLEIMQKKNTSSVLPLTLGPDSVYKRTGMEPAALSAGGEVFNDGAFDEPIGCYDANDEETKQISVRGIRAGGDGTSDETYEVQIFGETI